MSLSDRASNDLRAGRIALQKLGLTVTDFQSHCFSIVSLGEQWKNLQNSLSAVHSSLENRVKEIDSKEREITMIRNQFEILQKQVELRQKTLDFREKSLIERSQRVEIREKQVKEWCESITLEKKLFSDHCQTATLFTKKRFYEEFMRVREVEERKREEACCAREEELERKLMMMSEKSEGLTVREEELNLREKKLNKFYEGMKLKESDMNTKEVKLEEVREKLVLKENELDELYNAVQLNETEVEAKEKELNEKLEELKVNEKKFSEKLEDLKVKEVKFNEDLEELRVKEKEFNEELGDLKVKDNELNVKSEDLKVKENELKVKSEDLKVKEKGLNEKLEDLKVKEKELNEKSEDLRGKLEKQLTDSCKVLELKGKKLDDNLQRMELKEKEVDELRQELRLKEKQLNEDRKALDLKEKRAEDRSKEAGKKIKQAVEIRNKQNSKFAKAEKKINSLKKELNLKNQELYQIKETNQKQVSDSVEIGPLPSCSGVFVSLNSGVDLHTLCKNMDANGVCSYLIVRIEEQKSLQEKMMDALKCAPYPAKLALDVFRKFHTKFENRHLTRSNKSSCIFVLEQLMKLSPLIANEVKVEAKEFAAIFKSGLKVYGCAIDSLGFLMLLVTFNLGNLYSSDDLLIQFNNLYSTGDICCLEENSYLCNALGLLDKIPALVKSLIDRKKFLSAIKYICVFKLECDFPVVPLLEAHMTHIKEKVGNKRKGGTFKSKHRADNLELCSLNDLIKCIRVFKLESKFPIDSILSRINKLRKEEPKSAITVAPTNKRNNADYSCDSEAFSNQLEKRQRVGDVHQVAPPQDIHIAPHCQPPAVPLPHTVGNGDHINPNVQQQNWQQGTNIAATDGLGYGVGPHLGTNPASWDVHVPNMPFQPHGMYPIRPHCAPGPFY